MSISQEKIEVIFEWLPVGAYMRLVAVDTKTGVEVTVMGPVQGSREMLERTALRKLQMAVERRLKDAG